jgi:hypothetical protein
MWRQPRPFAAFRFDSLGNSLVAQHRLKQYSYSTLLSFYAELDFPLELGKQRVFLIPNATEQQLDAKTKTFPDSRFQSSVKWLTSNL